jgi:hypothetical protein
MMWRHREVISRGGVWLRCCLAVDADGRPRLEHFSQSGPMMHGLE